MEEKGELYPSVIKGREGNREGGKERRRADLFVINFLSFNYCC